MDNIECCKEMDDFFDSLLGSENNLKEERDKAFYNKGYRYGEGRSLRVIRPKTTEQVVDIVKFCRKKQLKLIAQGGNSGLTGASSPDNSGQQIILSTALLNRNLIELDGMEVAVGSGVILDQLNTGLERQNLFLPIDIGSAGSCNIGGMIATNAAGTRAGRYGNTASRVLSVEVVTGAGDIIECLATAKKAGRLLQDNSIFDFDNPFAGSSGWLGIITKATLKLEKIPAKTASILLVPKDNTVIDIIREKLSERFGQGFTAFEGMTDNALRLVARHIPNTPYLFAEDNLPEDSYVLLAEISSYDVQEDLSAALEEFFIKLYDSQLVITARSDKPELFWHVRHHISEAIKKEGKVIACDIAVPLGSLAVFREEMSTKVKQKWSDVIVTSFGHEMIGAAHFNIIWPNDKELSDTDKGLVQDYIYKTVIEDFAGTFSAEHGIGPHNQQTYDRYMPDEVKQQARLLKQKYDPDNVLGAMVDFAG